MTDKKSKEMNIVELLTAKNLSLETFAALSESVGTDFNGDNIEILNRFHLKREAILKTIHLLDQMISVTAEALSILPRNDQQIADLKILMSQGDALVERIKIADEQVLQAIQSTRTELLKEISAQNDTRKKIKKFRTNWAEK